MTRLHYVKKEEVAPELKDIYQQLESKMGKVINIFQAMANSPATLKGFLALSQAAEETGLSPKLREKIALLCAQTNQCNYCLAAHTKSSKALGLDESEIKNARDAKSDDAKTEAILVFAQEAIEKNGNLPKSAIDTLKHASVSDKEIVEIIMVICVNLFTNYFNLITDTKLDFPEVDL